MSYGTPEAFKQALEARLRKASTERSQPISRVRQLIVFDRFLARVFDVLGERASVKGGAALELRLARARTTRDVDLRVTGKPTELLDSLSKAAQLDRGDFFSFDVIPAKHPQITGDGVVYGGQRFRVEARLADKLYGDPFGLDAGFGDVLTTPIETHEGNNFLAFAGIAPTRYRIYPREAHVAEKLHAYTMPRPRENTRVKDLPDLALLATSGPFTASTLQRAIEATFAFRHTHPVPQQLPAPPSAWAPAFADMAKQDDLPWRDLDSATAAVQRFLDPVLARGAGIWNPSTWGWHPLEQERQKKHHLTRK